MDATSDLLARTAHEARLTLEAALSKNRSSSSVRALGQAVNYAEALVRGERNGDYELALAWLETATKKVVDVQPHTRRAVAKQSASAESRGFAPS